MKSVMYAFSKGIEFTVPFSLYSFNLFLKITAPFDDNLIKPIYCPLISYSY